MHRARGWWSPNSNLGNKTPQSQRGFAGLVGWLVEWMVWMVWYSLSAWYSPKTNMGPENRPSQKERTCFPSIISEGRFG